MPRFEVTSKITIAFDADSKEQAKFLVESGETPRDHELIAAFVSDVDQVITEEEQEAKRKQRKHENQKA